MIVRGVAVSRLTQDPAAGRGAVRTTPDHESGAGGVGEPATGLVAVIDQLGFRASLIDVKPLR